VDYAGFGAGSHPVIANEPLEKTLRRVLREELRKAS
jgi:hypothetical protein